MLLIADVLMVGGALGAGLYCYILSRRLRRFTDLEKGVGGAVAVLSMQVDDLTKTLSRAQTTAQTSVGELEAVSKRAELAREKLQLLMASLHDLPEPARPQSVESPFFVRRAKAVGAEP